MFLVVHLFRLFSKYEIWWCTTVENILTVYNLISFLICNHVFDDDLYQKYCQSDTFEEEKKVIPLIIKEKVFRRFPRDKRVDFEWVSSFVSSWTYVTQEFYSEMQSLEGCDTIRLTIWKYGVYSFQTNPYSKNTQVNYSKMSSMKPSTLRLLFFLTTQ